MCVCAFCLKSSLPIQLSCSTAQVFLSNMYEFWKQSHLSKFKYEIQILGKNIRLKHQLLLQFFTRSTSVKSRFQHVAKFYNCVFFFCRLRTRSTWCTSVTSMTARLIPSHPLQGLATNAILNWLLSFKLGQIQGFLLGSSSWHHCVRYRFDLLQQMVS